MARGVGTRGVVCVSFVSVKKMKSFFFFLAFGLAFGLWRDTAEKRKNKEKAVTISRDQRTWGSLMIASHCGHVAVVDRQVDLECDPTSIQALSGRPWCEPDRVNTSRSS